VIRILLADDHKIIRDGLRSLLDKEHDLQVIAEAENGREAMRLVRKHRPDLVVMDITMPELNGIDATAQITAEMPATRVIALSMHSERQFIQGMLAAGVSGYLLKDCAFDELIGAVRSVLRGKIYLSPDIAGVVVEDFVSRAREIEARSGPVLTPREREVLQLIAEGVATRDIAGQLHLSVKTIESHRKNIMQKLDLHTLADLIKYAIREGLTSLDR